MLVAWPFMALVPTQRRQHAGRCSFADAINGQATNMQGGRINFFNHMIGASAKFIGDAHPSMVRATAQPRPRAPNTKLAGCTNHVWIKGGSGDLWIRARLYCMVSTTMPMNPIASEISGMGIPGGIMR